MRKRATKVVDIALDFADELSEGERIAEIISVDCLTGATEFFETCELPPGSTAGFYTVNADGSRNERRFPALQRQGMAAFLLRESQASVETKELAISWGQGSGPDERKVIIRLGRLNLETLAVEAGGVEGKVYTVRARIRTEFGRVIEKTENIEVF